MNKDEANVSADPDLDQMASQVEVFKSQFLQSVTKYEEKIKELSLLKELGSSLRSCVFSDRDSFLRGQVAVVKKLTGLKYVSLMLAEPNLRMFEVIEPPLPGDGIDEPVWVSMHNNIAATAIQNHTHVAVAGTMEDNDNLYVPIVNNKEVIAVLHLEGKNLSDLDADRLSFYNMVADQFATAIVLASMYHHMLYEEKQRLQIGRFFSKSVAQKIFSAKQDLVLDGQRLEVTTMFADLCGFTSMSEEMNEQDVVDALNSYFSLMTPIVFKYDGTLDKLLGDGIMAFFGAPIPHKDDTLRAVKAAVEMMLASRRFRAKGDDKYPLSMSIGITNGFAVAGYIGTDEHMNYTVIGDIVNTAQRLESACERDNILIGESVYRKILPNIDSIEHLKEVVQCEPINVKGKGKSVANYKLIVE